VRVENPRGTGWEDRRLTTEQTVDTAASIPTALLSCPGTGSQHTAVDNAAKRKAVGPILTIQCGGPGVASPSTSNLTILSTIASKSTAGAQPSFRRALEASPRNSRISVGR